MKSMLLLKVDHLSALIRAEVTKNILSEVSEMVEKDISLV